FSLVSVGINTVDIFFDSDEMKRAVWQTEGVFQNSFTRCTTRDRSHGHLKSIAGTRQAAAQIYRRATGDDPGATRTCQLPESGSLWRLLGAHLLAPVSAPVSVDRVPRQNAPGRDRQHARTDRGAGCFVHSQERQEDLRAGQVLQRLRQPTRARTGNQ